MSKSSIPYRTIAQLMKDLDDKIPKVKNTKEVLKLIWSYFHDVFIFDGVVGRLVNEKLEDIISLNSYFKNYVRVMKLLS